MSELVAGTAEQLAFLEELTANGLLIPSGVPGVYGRGTEFESLRLALDALVTRSAIDDVVRVERMAFPPVIPRRQLEEIGYLGSFPSPRRLGLLVHRRRGAGGRAGRAGCGPRRLERVPDSDRSGPGAGCVLSVLSGGRCSRRPAGRRRLPRSGRELRVPERALLGPGADADVPPARARSLRRTRARRRLASEVVRPGASSCFAGARARRPRRRSPRIRSSAAPAACSPAASAPRRSSSRSACRSAERARPPSRRSIATGSISRGSTA